MDSGIKSMVKEKREESKSLVGSLLDSSGVSSKADFTPYTESSSAGTWW